MATLEYDFRVVGERALDRAFAGVERRIVRHNAFLARQMGAKPGAASKGPAAAKQNAANHYAQIGKAAQAQYLKEGRDRIALEKRVANEKERLVKREEARRIRSAERIAAAERRAADRAGKAAMRSRQRFASATAGRVGAAGRNALSAVGGLATGALAIGGGFALAGALSTQSREQAKASQLANQAGNPALKGQLLREARGVRGFTGEEALGGIEEFVTKTGDLETARGLIGKIGELALATGADLGDLGATAGQAFNVLSDQIADPAERLKELNSLMGVLAQQGAMGTIEIRDLAHDFGKLGAATRAFEGSSPDLLRAMGAMAQVAARSGGAESSADASTAAMRLSSDIVTNRKKFKNLGVDIKSKSDPTKLRNPLEIIGDVLEKTGGDVEKTGGLFGQESKKIFTGFGSVFSAAEKKKKGSGRAALMAEFGRFAGAKLDPAALKERAASRLSDPDLQFKETLKQFNTALGESLLPTLTRLIPQFSKLLPYIERAAVLFGRLIDSFAKNPIEGLGKLILMKIAADLAMANIGSVLKNGIEKAINATMGAFGGKGGTAPGGGMAGAAGMGLQIGLTAATVILTAGIVNIEKQEADMSAQGRDLALLRTMGPGQSDEAKEIIQRMKGRADEASKPGMVEQGAAGLASMLPYWMRPTDPNKFGADVATSVTAKRPDVEKTQEDFLKQGQAEADRIEKAAQQNLEAAKMMKEGGQAIKEGAAMLKDGGLNRGNAPSPVKG